MTMPPRNNAVYDIKLTLADCKPTIYIVSSKSFQYYYLIISTL